MVMARGQLIDTPVAVNVVKLPVVESSLRIALLHESATKRSFPKKASPFWGIMDPIQHPSWAPSSAGPSRIPQLRGTPASVDTPPPPLIRSSWRMTHVLVSDHTRDVPPGPRVMLMGSESSALVAGPSGDQPDRPGVPTTEVTLRSEAEIRRMRQQPSATYRSPV